MEEKHQLFRQGGNGGTQTKHDVDDGVNGGRIGGNGLFKKQIMCGVDLLSLCVSFPQNSSIWETGNLPHFPFASPVHQVALVF